MRLRVEFDDSSSRALAMLTMDTKTTDRIGAKVTTKRGRRDDWRTQTDSNAVASRFSRGAATLDVPTPLVEGAHARSVRLRPPRLVSLPFASFHLASSSLPILSIPPRIPISSLSSLAFRSVPFLPFRVRLPFRRVSFRREREKWRRVEGWGRNERNSCRESFFFFSLVSWIKTHRKRRRREKFFFWKKRKKKWKKKNERNMNATVVKRRWKKREILSSSLIYSSVKKKKKKSGSRKMNEIRMQQLWKSFCFIFFSFLVPYRRVLLFVRSVFREN